MTSDARWRETSKRQWQTRLGWIVAAIGLVLFVGGNLGARIGFGFLPFDPHHVYAQLGGAVMAIVGVMWAINDDRR